MKEETSMKSKKVLEWGIIPYNGHILFKFGNGGRDNVRFFKMVNNWYWKKYRENYLDSYTCKKINITPDIIRDTINYPIIYKDLEVYKEFLAYLQENTKE